MAVVLLPHQVKALENLSPGKVLKGGVGSGKTPTSLAYYWMHILGGTLNDFSSITQCVDLYIFTTARKRDSQDWQTWGSRFGLSEDPGLSIFGIKFVVDSYNNMHKYKGVKNAFIILDEQRMVGSGLWSKTFLFLAKSNRWIMLSATPADKWEDYIPLFVANGFYKNRTEITREHFVYSYYGSFPKLERYVGVAKLERLKRSILVEMPFERHTKRHIHTVEVDYDRDLFRKVVEDRWNPYTERPQKDAAELFATMRKVVNSSPSRIEELKSLIQRHPKCIVFYNFDYELETLRSLAGSRMNQVSVSRKPKGSDTSTTSWPATTLQPPLILDATGSPISSKRKPSSIPPRPASLKTTTPISSSSVLAEYNGHKHDELPTGDEWVYLVQYAAGAEAWNCITTDAMAFYSLNYSYKIVEQCMGRIDRLDTPYTNLQYYFLKSRSAIDRAIWQKILNKESFNEKDFIRKMLR